MTVGILVIIAAFLALGFFLAQRSRNKAERLRKTGIYPLPGEETEEHVDRLIQGGHKIEAIKVFRILHGVGLREAKEAVEKRQREIGKR